MDKPLISVIIPVYNGEKYIDELMAQFLSQQPRCFELVFVDDGSCDGTYETLSAWQTRVPFAVVIHRQPNGGVSAARNRGAELARGEFITYVDVDDGIAADYIANLTACAQRGADVVVFDSQRVTTESFTAPSSLGLKQPEPVEKNEQLRRFLADPTKLGVYNLLLKSEFIRRCGISFAVGYKYYEDYDYLLQVFAQAEAILSLERVLYYYIMRSGSAMGRFNADRVTCLELMRRRGAWLYDAAPEFAPLFEKWGVARLYWSVLWQAALALPTYGEFGRFARMTGAREMLKKVILFPDWELRLSTWGYLVCPPLYRLAVRFVGGRRSAVETVRLEDIKAGIEAGIDQGR